LVTERATCAPLGTPREYLTIHVERVGLTIKVPVDHATELGLRPPATREQLRGALDVVSGPPSDSGEAWQARIRANGVKLSEGSILGAAEVLRDLASRATRRPLGMQERDQQARALELLEGQIMYAMELDAADARALLAERLPVQESIGG
jgi:RNA polymerase-interacting CarD/CdnL/TRCF family regulator